MNVSFYAIFSTEHFLTFKGFPFKLIIPIFSFYLFIPDIKNVIAESPSDNIAIHSLFFFL